MKNAPRNFLHLYLPDIAANVIDKITNTEAGAKSMAWVLSKLPGNGTKRYASFLKIGKSVDQLHVFETLMQQYDDPNMKFVALTMFMEKCGADVSETGFEGQLEEILMVKKQYPDNLLIFLGIDPRWKYSGTELRLMVQRYFERRVPVTSARSVYPFVGLKLYPSMGFYAFDEKLKETFEWAANNGVPVLSHCNYLGGIYSVDATAIKASLNPFDVYTNQFYSNNFPGSTSPVFVNEGSFIKQILGTNKNDNSKKSCSYFLEPASYESMINYFEKIKKPLKLCLAHFGGDEHILAQLSGKKLPRLYGMLQQNWCGQIIRLMQQHPSVYTDIAYALANPDIHGPVFKELNDLVYGERILFGTDFFLTERELPEKSDYAKFKEGALNFPLTNYNNISAWEQIASKNAANFLRSKYYNGSVI